MNIAYNNNIAMVFTKNKQKKRGNVHTQASQAISDGLALFVLP